MLKLLSSNLWAEIETLSANAKRKLVAVAYFSDDLRIKFKSGDTLITDASEERISNGNTSKKLLANAFDKRVNVYSLPDLHSKIFIFDNILIIGSTNISSSSRNRLHEAGIVTDDPTLVAQAENLLEKYKRGAKRINKKLLQKINSIELLISAERPKSIGDDLKPPLLDLLRSNH